MGSGAAGQGVLRGGLRLRAWLRGRGGGGQEVRQAQDVHQGILHRGGEERPRHHARRGDVSTSGRRRISYVVEFTETVNLTWCTLTLSVGNGCKCLLNAHAFNSVLIKYCILMFGILKNWKECVQLH